MKTMEMIKALGSIMVIAILVGCTGNKLQEKGFSVNQETESEGDNKIDGLAQDSLQLETRPGSVLLTGIPEHRLTPVYKVNYNKKTETPFIGSNYFHSNYTEYGNSNGNRWHYNFMPGLEAVYGYNMVNVSHYNIKTQTRKDFFASPVLIKTLYYPSFTSDTLNFMPVLRDYYMISVYDEDTNEDGFVNVKDLRRFYFFDIEAENMRPLVPKNYSVLSSEYDSANDFMYVFAKLDQNENGKRDEGEETHIFWVDLKSPQNKGRQY